MPCFWCFTRVCQVELFEPEISKSGHIGDAVLQANLNFLRDYANVNMPKRSQNFVQVQKEDIKSGDFLAIIRISGLETMQVWGMFSGRLIRYSGTVNRDFHFSFDLQCDEIRVHWIMGTYQIQTLHRSRVCIQGVDIRDHKCLWKFHHH